MTNVGVRQMAQHNLKGVLEQAQYAADQPPTIGEYEEEVTLDDTGPQSAFQAGGRRKVFGTNSVLHTLYDQYGRERQVPRQALSYYRGKMRVDVKTGRVVPVFTEQPPRGIKRPEDEKEGIDFATCEVCGQQCRLDVDIREKPANMAAAVQDTKAMHILRVHREKAAWYLSDEIIQRNNAVMNRR